jgi:hypothetical protein
MTYSEVQYQYMAIDWTTIYKKYKGQWVALKDDEKSVIASAKTAVEALKKAQKKGYEKPILSNVPASLEPYVGYGL